MVQSSLGRKGRVKFTIRADPGSEVYVAGTFNGWHPSKHKMSSIDGVYSTSLLVPKGRHEYKFVINGTWCVDPECQEWIPNGHGSLNSVITVV